MFRAFVTGASESIAMMRLYSGKCYFIDGSVVGYGFFMSGFN